MATYTIELRNLLNTNFVLPLNQYPIWDESYRTVLNQKFIDRYLFREIGAETPDRWAHYLKTKMNEIMPYYNDLYQTTTLQFNPLYTTDMTETRTLSKEDDTTSTSSSSGIMENTAAGTVKTDTTQTLSTTEGERTDQIDTMQSVSMVDGQRTDKSVKSDTPQGNINIANVETGGFASEVNVTQKGQQSNTNTSEDSSTSQKGQQTNTSEAEDSGQTTSNQNNESTSSTTANATGKLQTTEEYVKHLSGYTTSPNTSIKEYRQNLINIDIMILDELADLFMGVY